MRRVYAAAAVAFSFGLQASDLKAAGCKNPLPIFHCQDWHKDASGRLVSLRPIRAGLLQMEENGYLGDHTIIGGIDYTEALKSQCASADPPPAPAPSTEPACINAPPVFDCAIGRPKTVSWSQRDR